MEEGCPLSNMATAFFLVVVTTVRLSWRKVNRGRVHVLTPKRKKSPDDMSPIAGPVLEMWSDGTPRRES